RFYKDVADQVKAAVLLASLEQLAEDHNIAPLSAPDINPSAIEIPKEGPLVYEFDVEVRPEFDLPNYRGLKLRRPVKEFSDDDVAKEEKSLLSRFAELIPKPGGVAQLGDYITADMTSKAGDRLIGELKAISMKVDTRLAFKDGVVENFADRVQGVKAG